MVTLGLMPFEASGRSGAQFTGQVAGGEGGRDAIDLGGGKATEQVDEVPLLGRVGHRTSRQRRVQQPRRVPSRGEQYGPGAAERYEKLEDAAPVGQGAVEIEGGHGRG